MATKLKINRGTTYIKTGTARLDGEALDISGSTVRFTVKSKEYDADATDSSAAISKDITDGTSAGAYTITINPSDTATLTPGKYYFSIKLDVDSDGATVYELDEGTITLDADPTNRLS